MGIKTCLLKQGMTPEQHRKWFGTDNELSDKDYAARMALRLEENDQLMRDTMIQVVTNQRAVEHLDSYKYKGKNDKGKALLSLLAFDKFGAAGNVSVDQMGNFYAKQAFSKMNSMMEKLMPKLGGGYKADPVFRRNLIKEIFGGNTGDADAKAFAQAWRDGVELMRKQYNSKGGQQILKKNMWGLPQHHNAIKIRAADKETWVGDTAALLDYTKMKNRDTGLGFTELEIKAALRETYDSIVTDGASKMDMDKAGTIDLMVASGIGGQERWMQFKNGDDWLTYQNKYGEDDIYSVMLNHVKSVGRDTALKEVFGPNPGAGYNYVRSQARKGTKNEAMAVKVADMTFKDLTGQYAGKLNNIGKAGEYMRGLSSMKLGGAAISSFSDQGTLLLTAKFNKLPMLEQMKSFVRNLNPNNLEDRRFLAHAGINTDYVIDSATQFGRFSDTGGFEWVSKLTDRFLRVTGLNQMTEAGKAAFAMSTLNMMANVSKKSFTDLHPKNRALFERYGITSDDWNKMRITQKKSMNGTRYLDPQKFGDTDLQMKVSGMIDAETHYAIPEADAQVRAMMKLDTKGGTVIGEAVRGGGQFKSFSVSVMVFHFTRIAAMESFKSKAEYAAFMFVFTTALGAVSVETKRALAGKKSKDYEEHPYEALIAATLQGGGLGIFGDFILADQSRAGSGLAVTLMGPSAADVDFFLSELLMGNVQGLVKDLDEGNSDWSKNINAMGTDTVTLVKRWLPTQAWQSKLVFDRLVFDQMNKLIDENYESKINRRESAMEEREGSAYYWRPGDVMP